MDVSHYPPTRCTAYVQRYATPHSIRHLELKLPALQTPLTQRCTCEAQLCDHIAIDNPYRVAEPWNVLDYLPDSSVPSSNDTMNNSFTANSVPFSSNTANGSLMPVTPMPITPITWVSHSLSPSSDARNIPFNPTLQSYPSASGTLHVDNDSYARQSGGSAMTGGYEYQYYSNAMYDATPEASPLPYRLVHDNSIPSFVFFSVI